MGVFESILLIGAGLGLYIYTQQRAAGHLVFFPDNVIGFQFDNATPVFTANILIQNTSNTSFTVYSFAGNVLTDSTLVGNVSSFQPITIPANAQVDYPIMLRMSLLGVVDDIISAFKDGNISKTLVIDGNVNANGYQVPVSLTYKLGI